MSVQCVNVLVATCTPRLRESAQWLLMAYQRWHRL